MLLTNLETDPSPDNIVLLQEAGKLLTNSTYFKETIGKLLDIIDKNIHFIDSFIRLKKNRETKGVLGHHQFVSQKKMVTLESIQAGLDRLEAIEAPTCILPNELPYPSHYGYTHPNPLHETILIVCPVRNKSTNLGFIAAAQHRNAPIDQNLAFLSTMASMLSLCLQIKSHTLVSAESHPPAEKTCRRPSNIIGNSKAMQSVFEMVWQVAKSDTTTLILGESGVGKELIANAIHFNSQRSEKPFIKVNCAALPDNLLESELFGYEKGAFTGALAQKKGRFEIANGGTLFLDEIGDFSPSTQVKLLRVLQEKEFERVGGTSCLKTDVRIVAATNRDLEEMINQSLFRQDLYYRLNVFPIHIPPLRERKTDILQLTDYFIEKYNRLLKKEIRRVSTPAIDMLMSYHWPGNIRELENCIERAVLISRDKVIHGQHLPPTLQTAEASNTSHNKTLKSTLDAVEREVIIDSLKSSQGNLAQASRELGVTERIMGLRVRKFGIDAKRFR